MADTYLSVKCLVCQQIGRVLFPPVAEEAGGSSAQSQNCPDDTLGGKQNRILNKEAPSRSINNMFSQVNDPPDPSQSPKEICIFTNSDIFSKTADTKKGITPDQDECANTLRNPSHVQKSDIAVHDQVTPPDEERCAKWTQCCVNAHNVGSSQGCQSGTERGRWNNDVRVHEQNGATVGIASALISAFSWKSS
jgi:hypothetical protein